MKIEVPLTLSEASVGGLEYYLTDGNPIFAAAVILPASVGVFLFSLWNNQAMKRERAQAQEDNERAGLLASEKVYNAGVFRIFMMIIAYAFASTATFMFNKAVITQIPYPHFVVAVQCAASILIFLALNYKDIHFGSFRTSAIWFVCVEEKFHKGKKVSKPSKSHRNSRFSLNCYPNF